MPNTFDLEELLLKSFRNKIDDGERMQLQAWMEESPYNRRLYKEMERFWRTKHQEPRYINDDELKNRIVKEGFTSATDFKPRARSQNGFMKMAAAVAILICALLAIQGIVDWDFFHQTSQVAMVKKESLKGQRLTTTLPDGTVVKLNSGASIEFPQVFKGKVRHVKLQGEAYFDVQRDERHPFVIETSDLEVKVLGTSFSVKSEQKGSLVAVRSGKVKVNNHLGSEVILNKGEMTRADSKSVNLRNYSMTTEQIECVFGWTEKKLVFKNDQIEDVLGSIEKWFGVDFMIENQVQKSQSYTATYKNPTLEEVMQSVAYVYGFKYEIENNLIMIK